MPVLHLTESELRLLLMGAGHGLNALGASPEERAELRALLQKLASLREEVANGTETIDSLRRPIDIGAAAEREDS